MASSSLPHFIDPDSSVAKIIEGIVKTANEISLSEDFSAGYNGEDHPYDVKEANSNLLLRFDTPGGGGMEGFANPGKGGNIGSAIHTLLMLLSPFITIYSLILPIFGIIFGILEVLCALMNPFAAIAAVSKLFKKWIPAFMSILPPIAGVALLQQVIEALLCLIYWVMTEVVPTIQLIVDNILGLIEAFANRDDLFDVKLETVEFKLKNLLKTLIQKLGILKAFKPVLELLFLILRLFAGFPCGDGRSSPGLLWDRGEESDSTCCSDFCPPILSDRSKAPEGFGVMLPAYYGDCMPMFVFQMFTINQDIQLLEPYQESLQEQMFCQMDEEIKYAIPPGATQNRALIKIEISDANQGPFKFTAPVLDISGPWVKIGSPLAIIFNGQLVYYKFKIDYDMMVMQSMIGIGCHPDVKLLKDNLAEKYPMPQVIEANPEAEPVLEDYISLIDNLDLLFNGAFDIVDGIAGDEPPFDDRVDAMNEVQNQAIQLLNDYADTLTTAHEALTNRNMDRSFSLLEVNKNVATADGKDFALITVTPKDLGNSFIARAIPNNIIPKVDILSTFGTITNKRFNNEAGTITAELRSNKIGEAQITAKVNNNLITDFNPEASPSETTRIRTVNFVSDAILPTRRKKTKPSRGKAVTTKTIF